MTAVLQRPAPETMGVAVLLVYGLLIPVPRDGQPGFRLTVQLDGAVWVQPVGFDSRERALGLSLDLINQCRELGLAVHALPIPAPGFVVRRRPTN